MPLAQCLQIYHLHKRIGADDHIHLYLFYQSVAKLSCPPQAPYSSQWLQQHNIPLALAYKCPSSGHGDHLLTLRCHHQLHWLTNACSYILLSACHRLYPVPNPMPIPISSITAKRSLWLTYLRGRCPRPLDECAKLAGDPGFEPGLTDPESVVLPLD